MEGKKIIANKTYKQNQKPKTENIRFHWFKKREAKSIPNIITGFELRDNLSQRKQRVVLLHTSKLEKILTKGCNVTSRENRRYVRHQKSTHMYLIHSECAQFS